MKKHSVISILLCVVLLCSTLFVPAYAETQEQTYDISVTNGYHSADAQFALLGTEQLVQNAKAVFLYEANSDTLMYAWNADAKLDPASFNKIMTALIAIENGDLTDAVTVKQEVLDTVNYDVTTFAPLVDNEVVTLEDLLYCMLVGSSNGAAVVIADHIAGSESAFVQMMNARAQELNCTSTQFGNPTGLPADVQYITARDIAKILAEAMKNETFAKIIGSVYYTVPKTNKTSEERKLTTGNFLMSADEMELFLDNRVIAGRTGSTNDGTKNLASVAKHNGMQLISIVMGAEASYKGEGYIEPSWGGYVETQMLLDAGFNGYKSVQLIYDGQVFLQRDVTDGNCSVSLGAKESLATVLPETVTRNQLSYRYTNTDKELTAPIKAGDEVCTVEIWHNGLCVATAQLYAMNSVNPAQTLVIPRAKNPVRGWVITAIVLTVIILIAIGYFVLRNWSSILRLIKSFRRRLIQRRRR